LDKLLVSQETRNLLSRDTAAASLFQFARLPNENGESTLPQLERVIAQYPYTINYNETIEKIFL
jgi:hypothetical protein